MLLEREYFLFSPTKRLRTTSIYDKAQVIAN